MNCCISIYSYIKPQLMGALYIDGLVVYLYIPTSNHNLGMRMMPASSVVYLYIPTSNHNSLVFHCATPALYIFIFLHQTTTTTSRTKDDNKLYIFIFLHQTTTRRLLHSPVVRCISLYSYIKPQPKETNILIIR